MNSATTHLSLHACSRRLGTNASRFRRLQFIYCQLVLGTRRVPYLAGKKLTLAWVAASAADEAAIKALIPTPPPGQQLDPSQLPRGLGSSIHLKPELRLDGTPVATGPGMGAGSEPVGQGGYTRYGQQDWDETQDPLIAGQQTAIGLSIQGISQAQLQTLKTRMEATQQKLEQAQAAPEAQRAAILQGLTGDHLTGDLLMATVWAYLIEIQSHSATASAQAQMFDLPALSYGLFHAQVKPNKLYGIVTTGITYQGLNMDVGHLRSIRWVKNDDPQSPINNKPELTKNGKPAAQNRWIQYNKQRGQYNSAMEHAVPERFWIDKARCRYEDFKGQTQNPTQADCAQAVSAVKAIAIAQAEGQRIYTINQSNAATALPKLPVGGTVGQEIQSAIQAGKEVTFHERGINAHGFSGYGYIITDPETGGGAYLIEGKGNGAWFFFIAIVFLILLHFVGTVAAFTVGLAFFVGFLFLALSSWKLLDPIFCKAGASIVGGTIFAAAFAAALIRLGGKDASALYRALLSGDIARMLSGITGAAFLSEALCE